MKNLFFGFMFLMFVYLGINGQTITGRVVDEKGNGLQSYKVSLYISPNVFITTTDSTGYFLINITEIKDEPSLPDDYKISNNYPNPFNPRTRIDITLPNASKIKAEVFNSIGQNVGNIIEKVMQAGNNYLDFELNGLPNGVYFARINIDDKYSVVRKMMLLYGSQHLNSIHVSGVSYLSKTSSSITIDSVVVKVGLMRTKTFINLPAVIGDELNLGNLTMQLSCEGMPTVTYGGKTYNTVQIGSQCWLRENLDIGTMILNSANPNNNNIIEKYCYNNLLSNCETYGGLYAWNEVKNYASQYEGLTGICPPGWHIPKNSEVLELKANIGEYSTSLLNTGIGNGTNTSGFSALLSGYIQNRAFLKLDEVSYFYCGDATNAMYIDKNIQLVDFVHLIGSNYSVRCLYGSLPGTQTILFPVNNTLYMPLNPSISWKRDSVSTSYWLQVATDGNFSNIVFSRRNIEDTSITIEGLNYSMTYYIRLRGENNIGLSVNWCNSVNFTVMPNYGPCPGAETVTYDGKIYHTVRIGNLCYLKENLDVGQMISSTNQQSNNSVIEKYCYDNNPANCVQYGGLYNWFEAMDYKTAMDIQGICPNGWRLPDKYELISIQNIANNNMYALLASGTNQLGFSAVLGGYYESEFKELGTTAAFLTSSFMPNPYTGEKYPYFLIINNTATLDYSYSQKFASIRCVKNVQ